MSKWSSLIIGNGKNIQKKNVTWNMIGSLTYAALSVILLMVVTRVVGEEQAGVFSIAFTTGQLALTLGVYNMHPFQATDVRGEYSFQDYFTVRCITCAAMIVFSSVYIAFSGYAFDKSLIVFLLCLYKMFDGLSDVYEGQYQLLGNLHISGKSLTFRSLFSGIIFCVVIFLTKNLLLSCIALIIAGLLGFLIFAAAVSRGMFFTAFTKSFFPVRMLLWTCLPLCISSFMSNYIVNSPKYSIDRLMSETHQAHYGMIFMPAFAINLCSGFIFKPMLTMMAELWNKKNYAAFKKIIVKLSLCVVVLTAVILLAGWFFGIPLLSWFYNVDLSQYKLPFMIILFGGGFSAMNTFIFYALTVMRSQRKVFWGYLITFIFAWVLPPLLVGSMGILGAAISYASLIVILDLIFLLLFALSYRKAVRQPVESSEVYRDD